MRKVEQCNLRAATPYPMPFRPMHPLILITVAVFDTLGKIVGMNSQIVSVSDGSVGIGFALPIETLTA